MFTNQKQSKIQSVEGARFASQVECKWANKSMMTYFVECVIQLKLNTTGYYQDFGKGDAKNVTYQTTKLQTGQTSRTSATKMHKFAIFECVILCAYLVHKNTTTILHPSARSSCTTFSTKCTVSTRCKPASSTPP